jgi:Trk K+ transport system NAD-binding subunit
VKTFFNLSSLLRRVVSWRSALLTIVFFAGFAGFALGGVVSERPSIATEPITAKFYYTLGLFVLAGIDLGLPVGGPALAKGLLWFAFFAAPAVTAGALTEGLLRIFRADFWTLRNLRGHVVLAGCGRLSMLYLARLREKRPGVRVVIVEKRADNENIPLAVARGARVVLGDITEDEILESVSIQRASRVMLLTGDDFANLDAATKILATAPSVASKVVVHVGDLRFAKALENSRVATECVLFNSHQVAASHLVESVLAPHFAKTPGCDALVLGGFGRFGQTVLDELQRRNEHCVRTVVIIDAHATRSFAEFGQLCACANKGERVVIDGDITDPRVIERAQDACATHEPAFVLGSNDDGANVRTAISLARSYPKALVIARGFGTSTFAREIAKDRRFTILSVGELLADSIPDRWLA